MRVLQKLIQTVTLAVVIATTAVVAVGIVRADTVTNVSVYPTTLQTSQASNHTVLFTTPSGVAEGETITLTFASAFNTASITEDDVDIADDSVDLTTASNCSGSEQASVAIASDVITVTICAGDGGAITAGSEVSIQIGTNATSSGTGTNQIINPSATGNYYIALAGTFGDTGSIVLPIGATDAFSVTATVPSSGGGGGGGDTSDPEVSGDTTAPVISDIVVSEVTTSQATISWLTSEPATRALDYGLTSGFELGTESSSSYFTIHSVTLTGLTEGTTYYFRIRASDSSANTATSSTLTFETLDETAPIISAIEVVDVTKTSARITWTTNEPATSAVSYGTTVAYGSSVASTSLTTSHSVVLTGLTAGTTYHFQVVSRDASLNQAISSDQSFATLVDLPPANVSGLSLLAGDAQLTLSWTNPTDEDLAGIRVLECLEGYPTGPTDAGCSVVSTSLTTSLTRTGRVNGTTYFYGVFAYDTAGQFASGALVQGVPQASEEEVPSEPDDEGPADPSDPEPGESPAEEEDSSETPSAESTGSCGDGVCAESESSLSCPLDCGQPEDPTSLGTEEGTLRTTDIVYSTADGTILLTATRSGVVEVLPTSTLSLTIPLSELSDGVRTIVVNVGSETYLMRRDDALALYEVVFTIPDVQTILQVSVLVTYENGQTESVSSFLSVVPTGYVYQVIDGEETRVSTATVTLFQMVGSSVVVWDGSPYRQFNPTSTNSDGTFAWYVPNGTYKVSAHAERFDATTSGELIIVNNIVSPQILLLAVKDPEEEPIVEPTQPEAPSEPRETAPASLAQSFLQSLPIGEIGQALEVVRTLPAVQKTAEVSVPTLAISAGASILVLSVAFDFLPFLQYLFTSPILFFWRRKRRGYGIVYNAISKEPIDLAVVRLFQFDKTTGKRGRLVKSRVTDKGGRYFFLVPPGSYVIQVTKPAFQFPSEYLKAEKTDGAFLDVYHGEPIEVTAEHAVVSANIPLDPSQAKKFHEPTSIRHRALLRRIQHGVAVAGISIAVAVAIVRPSTMAVLMIAVQVVVYFLARRLATPRKPISWGIVYDKETGRPVSRVVARVFEPTYHKLLETQITDSKGRYAFVLGPNQYYATFQKEGFVDQQVNPIDFTNQTDAQEFNQQIELTQRNSGPKAS